MKMVLFEDTSNPSIYLDINQAQLIISALHKIGRSESINLMRNIHQNELKNYGESILLKFVNQGFSNTVVLRLHTGNQRGDSIKTNMKSIIKIGRFDDVNLEHKNYKENLDPTTSSYVPRMIYFSEILKRWAAILYEDLGEIDTFQEIYINGESEELLLESIKNIFGKMEENWYKNATLESTNLYSDQFNLIQSVAKYQNAIKSIIPDEFNKENIELRIGEEKIRLKNPIHFLLNKQDSRKKITHLSIVHGDCHGGNIVLNKNNKSVFLVDFANMSNTGHIFKDYVKLESNILYRLYDYDKSKKLSKSLEHWLNLVAFSLGYKVPKPVRDEDRKAWACICELRSRARKMKIDYFSSDEWMDEYLVGVLHWTLSSIYWTDIFNSKKHLAFYSAAMICHAIENNYEILSE